MELYPASGPCVLHARLAPHSAALHARQPSLGAQPGLWGAILVRTADCGALIALQTNQQQWQALSLPGLGLGGLALRLGMGSCRPVPRSDWELCVFLLLCPGLLSSDLAWQRRAEDALERSGLAYVIIRPG